MSAVGQIHNLAADEVYAALASRWQGLTAAEASDRLREIGRNSVELPDRWRHLRSLTLGRTKTKTIVLV